MHIRQPSGSLVARVVAPDLIAGLYTPEELGAEVDAEGAIVSKPDAPVQEEPPVEAPKPKLKAARERKADPPAQDVAMPPPDAPVSEDIVWTIPDDPVTEAPALTPYEAALLTLQVAADAPALRRAFTGCVEAWATFTPEEQTGLIAAKDQRKRDLGIT